LIQGLILLSFDGGGVDCLII